MEERINGAPKKLIQSGCVFQLWKFPFPDRQMTICRTHCWAITSCRLCACNFYRPDFRKSAFHVSPPVVHNSSCNAGCQHHQGWCSAHLIWLTA